AIVFLRDFERSREPRARADAVGLLAFVTAMEQGDGEYVNFVGADGRPNRSGPTTAKAFSYWGARALWAEAEAVRVLGPGDPAVLALRPVLDRSAARFGRDVAAGRLSGGSSTATA